VDCGDQADIFACCVLGLKALIEVRPSLGNRQVVRWQLDSKIVKALRCFLAETT